METIIERLRKVPVCELDGQLRRVRCVLPSELAVAWRIGGVAGNLCLSPDVRVCFHEGDTLTEAELACAWQSAPDCWQVPRQDGRVQTLRLFHPSSTTVCRITVTQEGRTGQTCLPVHQLTTPATTVVPAGTVAPDGPAVAPAGAGNTPIRG